jgi:hypothetical protein
MNLCRTRAHTFPGDKCTLVEKDVNTYAAWSAWGECVGPECGGCAVQARRRLCYGDACTGPSTAYRRCRTKMCTTCAADAPANVTSTLADSDVHLVECLKDHTAEQCQLHQQVYLEQTQKSCPCCKPLKPTQGYCAA